MSFLPMARVTGFGGLPALLEERGGTRDFIRAFEGSGVPLSCLDDRRLFVPFTAMCNVFEEAAKRVGDPCFGLDVGMGMTPESFGKWLVFCSQARTLSGGLVRVERMSHHQLTAGTLHLDRRPDVSFWRLTTLNGVHPSRQHTEHLVWPMIMFVRRYLGPTWTPEWVEVDHQRPPEWRLAEDMLGVPIRFASQCLAIPIPTRRLEKERSARAGARGGAIVSASDVIAEKLLERQGDLDGSIHGVVMFRLANGETSIDGAAQVLGLGVQQLQRALRRQGTTYRQLLQRAKLERARSLLSETDLSITEIALSLGYSDSTGLSRAFRRLSGETASGFKRRGRLLA